MSIALESRYFHGGPHRPPHIVVRDDQNRVFSVDWVFDSELSESQQHWRAVTRALWRPESPMRGSFTGVYSARWKTGWRHIVVTADESAE